MASAADVPMEKSSSSGSARGRDVPVCISAEFGRDSATMDFRPGGRELEPSSSPREHGWPGVKAEWPAAMPEDGFDLSEEPFGQVPVGLLPVDVVADDMNDRSQAVHVSEEVLAQLSDMAESLRSIATSMEVADHSVSAALSKHADRLRSICEFSNASDPPQHPEDRDAFMRLMEHQKTHGRAVTPQILGFRDRAAEAVSKTGKPGEIVDDLREVNISEVGDKLAISYWRFCSGLRVFQSEMVTRALRLICAAPVPGLGGTSYLEVFKTLTQSSAWENHIYLFGGLVRDILRRTVGNDIDIGFSAPAAELEAICKQCGYECSLDGDYILIGDGAGEEFLEGMVISFNGIQPPEHADFSMNTLFYDFTNDIIIDKTGIAVDAVVANRCDLPCPRDRWKSWIDINGVRVCFRYYKFLLRGYTYDVSEMRFVTETLLDFWNREEAHTIEVGRIALGNLVECRSEETVEGLRKIVFETFEMVAAMSRPSPRKQGRLARSGSSFGRTASLPESLELLRSQFLSAASWWQKGWLPLLKLSV